MKINNQELDINTLNKYLIANSTKLKNYFPIDSSPFIDLTITSPPYWNAKQYGDGEQSGFGQSYELYLEDMKSIFEGVYSLSKSTASLYIIIDTIKRDGKMLRLPDDFARMLESIGWYHQDTIIWDKGKTLPWSRKGQTRNIFEYILMFTKSNVDYKYNVEQIKSVDELKEWWIDYPERYSPEGKVPENIWKFNIPTQGSWGSKQSFDDVEFRHACPFPPEMMARLVKLSSDEEDLVFDPFAGTGVLLATAKLLNRKYLGFDTNKNYKQVFEKVTVPLVEQKWPEIETYYEIQEELKHIMKSSISKLRILKYPKTLIKSLNKSINSVNENELFQNTVYGNFLLSVAIRSDLTEEDILKNKIGRVTYYFIINDSLIGKKDTLNHIIKEKTSKAPLSKFGLSVDCLLCTKEEFLNDIIFKLSEDSYLYANGQTKSYNKKVSLIEIQELFIQEKLQSYFFKDLPPIISNIKISEDEYSMLPAEKYEKKSLIQQLLK
ncbi:DNA methyltransferase [Psychrobacillus sp. FSL H8-0483]|uniref:DNA methyltransferase n=1 Tax=Psychrobacillus sp. FSL H8-0483 TaxID=2921389 RepID=UPI00315AA5FF